MKLLFLCKRRPQGKDLIERPYGRFYFLPKVLAEKGHEVHILLLSYKNEPENSIHQQGIHWTSVSLPGQGPRAYVRKAKKIINETKPDWVIGFSDTYYGILAQRLADKYKSRSLIDAYDNYESYIPWMKPLHVLWRKSLSRATLVTAPGPGLLDLLGKSRSGEQTELIPMAADPQFQPMDKLESRKKLGLPVAKKLVGYSGSTITANRGVDDLFQAFTLLNAELPDLELILSGRKGSGVALPTDARWLGYIPDAEMPLLINSLDLLVVMNQPSSFGNYSYPVKLYEAMSCQVPVVVTASLSTKWIMRHNQELLVESKNLQKLSAKIKYALTLGRIDYGKQPNWIEIGSYFEKLLLGNNNNN